jgi:uncharacterized protein YdcH (DUF465 family)
MNKKLEDAFFKRLFEVLDEETQHWWAKKISVSQGTISNLYKKKYSTIDKIIKIMALKKISPNWLILGSGPKDLKYLDEKEIGKIQDRFRDSQEKMAELEYSNLMLQKQVKQLENRLIENELLSLNGDKDIDIVGLMTIFRMVNDVIFKIAEVFTKKNLDSKNYGEILKWFKNNFETQKYGTAAAMENLNSIIKIK